MKLGRVVVQSYVVDLDNEEMVDRAMTCTYEDIMNAVKYNEVGNMLSTVEIPDGDPADIPEFLKDEEDYQ